ncbi:MAG TPA: cytochrome c [Candidatus Acidoferrum sp.]|jgi:mono/diheme cytochrome c family protein|nr:cytochrome c [Candidatus Acidoferrum sp.]
MSNPVLRTAALASALIILGAASSTVTVTLPPDNVQFKPGPGADLVTANCATCHSAAYIYTQPPLNSKQWTAEVLKMQKAYGAPIAQSDVSAIVDYLLTQNGRP